MGAQISGGSVISGVIRGISAVTGSAINGAKKAISSIGENATAEISKKKDSETNVEEKKEKRTSILTDPKALQKILDTSNGKNPYGISSPGSQMPNATQQTANSAPPATGAGIPSGMAWGNAGAHRSNGGSGGGYSGSTPGSGPINNTPTTPPSHNHTSLASITQERNEYVKSWGGHVTSSPSDTWPRTISITGLDAKAVAGFNAIQQEYGEFRAKHDMPLMNVTQKIEYSADGKANITVVLNQNDKQIEQQTSSSMTQMVAENNSREQQQRAEEASRQSIERESSRQQTA